MSPERSCEGSSTSSARPGSCEFFFTLRAIGRRGIASAYVDSQGSSLLEQAGPRGVQYFLCQFFWFFLYIFLVFWLNADERRRENRNRRVLEFQSRSLADATSARCKKRSVRDTAALWQELLTVQQLPRDERRGLGSFETEKSTRKTRKIHKKEFQSEAENSHGHQTRFRKPRKTELKPGKYTKKPEK